MIEVAILIVSRWSYFLLFLLFMIAYEIGVGWVARRHRSAELVVCHVLSEVVMGCWVVVWARVVLPRFLELAGCFIPCKFNIEEFINSEICCFFALQVAAWPLPF